MKKIYWGITLLFTLDTVSCQSDEIIEPTVAQGVYQWDLNENLLYVFGEYELNIIQDGVLSFDGNYTLEDGVLNFWDDYGLNTKQVLTMTPDGFILDNTLVYVKIGNNPTLYNY